MSGRRWTPEERVALAHAFETGMSDEDAALLIGRTPKAVRHMRQRSGMLVKTGHLRLTDERRAAVRSALDAGWSVARISRSTGIDYQRLVRLVRRMRTEGRA